MQRPMRVIAFIEQAEVIRKILEHQGLWGVRRKPVPRANVYPPPEGATGALSRRRR